MKLPRGKYNEFRFLWYDLKVGAASRNIGGVHADAEVVHVVEFTDKGGEHWVRILLAVPA